jgi:SAM-dependent methyltransferase
MNNLNISRHLDLGCGATPRNPLHCKELFGCDIREDIGLFREIGFIYKKANLTQGPIPFPDHFFSSVSAFDFIEHVPRQFLSSEGALINPFVNLMSEIHRVLITGGRFIAITPAYPRPEAFRDPTHVNIITDDTHSYFIGEQPDARAYGFKGKFKVNKVCWTTPKNAHDLFEPNWRKVYRNFEHRAFKKGLSHLLWDLTAT